MKTYGFKDVKRIMLSHQKNGNMFVFIDGSKSEYPICIIFNDDVIKAGNSVPEIIRSINEGN